MTEQKNQMNQRKNKETKSKRQKAKKARGKAQEWNEEHYGSSSHDNMQIMHLMQLRSVTWVNHMVVLNQESINLIKINAYEN